MKFAFIILIVFYFNSFCYSQDFRIGRNFVIAINNELAVNINGSVRFRIKELNGKEKIMDGGYMPGELYLSNKEDYLNFISDSLSGITLEFDNYVYKKNKMYISNYSVNISRYWLEYDYIILYIYNRSKNNKTNKYSFAWSFPSYSIPSKN